MSVKDYIRAIRNIRQTNRLEKISYRFLTFWSDGDMGEFPFTAPNRKQALTCTDEMMDSIDEILSVTATLNTNTRTVTSCALLDGKGNIVADYLREGTIRIPVLMDDYA